MTDDTAWNVLTGRLAFTTLGISGAPLTEVAALAVRTGWTGVELRSAPDEPVHVGLDAQQRRDATAALGGVEVLATNSYVRAGLPDGDDDAVVADLLAEAALARDLGAPAVRVFPGAGEAAADNAMVRRLAAAAPQLPDGVELWLETHDSHRTGAAVATVLDAVDHPRVRAIWDIAHPPKQGEAWPDTLTAIWPHLAHVQIKDELPGQVPLFLGDGDVPILPIVAALLNRGYPGWFSLEYELKWHPTAPPLAEALTRATVWLQSRPLG